MIKLYFVYTIYIIIILLILGEQIDDNVKLPNDYKTVQFGVPIFIQKNF